MQVLTCMFSLYNLFSSMHQRIEKQIESFEADCRQDTYIARLGFQNAYLKKKQHNCFLFSDIFPVNKQQYRSWTYTMS